MIYTLDTNVLVDALRQPTELDYLKAFLTWSLTNGDALAKELGYAPLPTALKERALAKVQSINAS